MASITQLQEQWKKNAGAAPNVPVATTNAAVAALNKAAASADPTGSVRKQTAPEGFVGSAYNVSVGSYDQQALKDRMNANSVAWWNADDAEKARLHSENEYLASLLGGGVTFNSDGTWTGAADGAPGTRKQSSVTDTGRYVAPELKSYTAQTGVVNDVYDAARDLTLAQLESAFDANELTLEAERATIPLTYQAQANAMVGDAERERQAFNEYAAASGLNSGAGGQAQLARSIQTQGGLSALRAAEAEAQRTLDVRLSQLEVQYQNDIATAVANGEYQRAAALMEEYRTQEQSLVSTAQAQAELGYREYLSAADRADTEWSQNFQQMQFERNAALADAEIGREIAVTDRATALQRAETLAQYGDFSGYLALGYTPDEVANMTAVWRAANPELYALIGGGATGGNVSSGGEWSGAGARSGLDVVISDAAKNATNAAVKGSLSVPSQQAGGVSAPENKEISVEDALDLIWRYHANGSYAKAKQIAKDSGVTDAAWNKWYKEKTDNNYVVSSGSGNRAGTVVNQNQIQAVM